MRRYTFKVNVHKVLFFLIVVMVRVLLDISYLEVVSSIFQSEGFVGDFDIVQYVGSWLVYFAAIVILVDRITKVSDCFFVMAVLAVIAPLTSLYGLDQDRPLYPVLVTVAATWIVYIVSRLRVLSFKRLPIVTQGRQFGIFVSLMFVAFLVIWFYVSGAKPNFDFTKIYEYREANAELTAAGVLAYTNNWTFQVFSVFLMSFALYFKRYLLVAILIVIQIYFFSVASHRTLLFLPLLVLSVWFYLRRSSSLLIFPLGCAAALMVTILTYLLIDDVWLSSLMSRRVFFVPAQLCFIYFDFFSDHDKVYWSNSVLSSFSNYPYGDMSIARTIGAYMGKPGMAANNGFVSAGFAQAGLLGVFIYSVILGVVLKLLDDVSSNTMPIWLAVAVFVTPLRSILLSSDLLTVMLTHGFGVAILLIILARKFNYSNNSVAARSGQN